MSSYSCSFTWVLGRELGALLLAGQTVYQLSHLLSFEKVLNNQLHQIKKLQALLLMPVTHVTMTSERL